MKVGRRNFLRSQELNKGKLFDPHVLTAFHCDWQWSGVMDSCGFKVTQYQAGGEASRNYVEGVYPAFIALIKKYDRGGKMVRPVLVLET